MSEFITASNGPGLFRWCLKALLLGRHYLHERLLRPQKLTLSFVKCVLPFAQDDVQHSPSRTPPQGLWFCSPGSAVNPADFTLE